MKVVKTLSLKEELFMENNVAKILRQESSVQLHLNVDDCIQIIVLTEDNPKSIKQVFNVLLKKLKKGFFQFELDDDTNDLYYHISNEYINQLNEELKSVFDEIESYGLLE